VGDVARPDLAIEKSEGARGIFRSLHEKLLTLPGDVEVWPGHLGGSMCGGPGMDMKVSSTIGFERDWNPVLSITDEEEFVAQALAKLGPQPPNFRRIVELNKGPLRTDATEIAPLEPRQVEERRTAGALLIDLRPAREFDEGHIPGAISNPMTRAGFGTKLAWVAGGGQEVVFVGRDDEDGRRAAALAAAVGLRNVAGYLRSGMTSWWQEGGPVEQLERLTVQELIRRADEDPGVQILDVREEREWNAGHIPGSAFKVWHDIDGVPEGIDPAKPIAVICESGQRAATAASLLQRGGACDVIHVVDGGVPTWRAMGRPLETSDGAAAAT